MNVMKDRTELQLSIQLGDSVDALPVSRSQLRRWAAAAIEGPTRLTVRFVGGDEGRELNRTYRGRDYATNVLTFPYEDHPDPEGTDAVQADIVICLPVVEREAREQHKTLHHHLAHLVIHGVLHATGYDHEEEDEATQMEARETMLLSRFRIPDPYADVDSDGRFEN